MHFLRKLKNKKLGLKTKTYELAKKVMLDSTGAYFKIYAKTGWGIQKNNDIGWFIGYVETKGNTYYFVHCLEKKSNLFKTDKDFDNFGNLRKNIVYKILKEKSII
jgi:beta-lactamase class D